MRGVVVVQDSGGFIVHVRDALMLLVGVRGEDIAEQRAVDGIVWGDSDRLVHGGGGIGGVLAEHVEDAQAHVVVVVVGREHRGLLHLANGVVEARGREIEVADPEMVERVGRRQLHSRFQLADRFQDEAAVGEGVSQLVVVESVFGVALDGGAVLHQRRLHLAVAPVELGQREVRLGAARAFADGAAVLAQSAQGLIGVDVRVA